MTATAREFLGGVFNGTLRACNSDATALVVNNSLVTGFIQSPASKRGQRGQLRPIYTEMFSVYVLMGEDFVGVYDAATREECELKLARRASPK